MTKVSFQLYSARNFSPLSSTLSMLGSLGYDEVEGYGDVYPTDEIGVEALKEELDAAGLKMASGHFGIEQLESDPGRALFIANTLGMDSVYAPWISPEEQPKDVEGWKAFGARLEKISHPFKEAGLEFGWHNHGFEFEPLSDGSRPHDRMFEAAPNLSWEIDVAWLIRGGADPKHYIEAYKDRITAVHMKDIAHEGENVDESGWADVGYGTIDWKTLFPLCKTTRAKHFMVEHDNPSDLKRLATRSIETLRSL